MLFSTSKLCRCFATITTSQQIFTLLLLSIACQLTLAVEDTKNATTTIKSDIKLSLLEKDTLPRIHSKRHSGASKDHAPKLIHQPQSVLVKQGEPHTIECPIESQPAAEVKWFKDNQPLESEPPRLELMANELMFIQMLDEDSGDYHCLASNSMGSIQSDHFRLTVQSSIHEPKIRFEPRLAEVGPDQQVRFTCTIPTIPTTATTTTKQRSSRRQPEVSWKRNGRPLAVKWLDFGEEEPLAVEQSVGSRFLAQQTTTQGSYVLTIARTQLKDDNATFTCLYRQQQQDLSSESSEDGEASQETSSGNGELLRESSPVRLRVYASKQVKLDVDLAPPFENLDQSETPSELPANNRHNNHTTQLQEPRRVNSLRETLLDLYELAKPILVVIGLVSLVGMFIVLQFVIIKRRQRSQNRYMKHHQYSSAGSGSSGGSSAIGCAGLSGDCGDPVLNSLMARTLSVAPSSTSLSGAGKKFRSYRDHMRKVAATGGDLVVGNDLVDGHYFRHQQQLFGQQEQQDPFFGGSATAMPIGQPNLYNQSLAAREQARSLLQAASSDHMRSLSSNLNNCHKLNQQHQQSGNLVRLSQNGSHLNLPLSFAFGGANRNSQAAQSGLLETQTSSQLMANALWQPHLAQMAAMMQQQQHLPANNNLNGNHHHQQKNHHQDEHYQLVNCSSISPSSTSSVVGSSNSSNQQQQHHLDHLDSNNQNNNKLHHKDSSQNHYSIIENEEDTRYEEVDQGQIINKKSRIGNQNHQDNSRTSTFVMEQQQQAGQQEGIMQKSSVRSSLKSNSSTSTSTWKQQQQDQNGLIFDLNFNRLNNSQRKSIKDTTKQAKSAHLNDNKRTGYCHDQLSPYAVSSICGSMAVPPPPQPPPVTSEAMQALSEQFDINHLMLLDESASSNQSLPPFVAPSPPPLPQPVDSQLNNDGQQRK